MNSEASNANKENEIIQDPARPTECLSPQTKQCVDLLMVGGRLVEIIDRA